MKLRFLISLGLLLLLFASPASSRLLGLIEQADSLMKELAQRLDSAGIDVRIGGSQGSLEAGSRPQLSLLADLPRDHEIRPPQGCSFAALFAAGCFSEARLLAVGPQIGIPARDLSFDAFKQVWDAAPKDQRVFVSFSGADIAHADKIKVALEGMGYTVFVYRDPNTGSITTNSVAVGTMFREAGRHLVIDTANARSSWAVRAEALALQSMRGRGGPPPLSETGTRRPKPGEPCCKLCRYRNGILLSCGPKQCGPQCRGAQTKPY